MDSAHCSAWPPLRSGDGKRRIHYHLAGGMRYGQPGRDLYRKNTWPPTRLAICRAAFTPFMALLRQIDFNPGRDTLWLTGDLVNRGPESLQVLRWVFDKQDCVQTVLGNHDLHLLAVAEGYGKVHADDTIQPILDAAESKVLLDWLRCQPLMIYEQGYAMVHAGLLPEWSIKKALRLAEEVEGRAVRQAPPPVSGQAVRQQAGALAGRPERYGPPAADRQRHDAHALLSPRTASWTCRTKASWTARRRTCCRGLRPLPGAVWIRPLSAATGRRWGLHLEDDVLAIDSGCLWGGSLTAVRLEDRAVFSLPCQAYREISR